MAEGQYEQTNLVKSTGKNNTHELLTSCPMDVGGKEGVKIESSVRIMSPEGRIRDVPTVSKEYPLEDMDKVIKIVETIDLLREKGYPVPSFARYYQKNGSVYLLLPNMTLGGTHRIWGRSGDPERSGMTNAQHQTLKEMNLTEDHLSIIKEQVLKIAKKASKDGYNLGMDKYLLDQEISTGNVKVGLLDFDPDMLKPPFLDNFGNRDPNIEIAKAWVSDLKEEITP